MGSGPALMQIISISAACLSLALERCINNNEAFAVCLLFGFFLLLLCLHCSTSFTSALVRSPHCFASKFPPRAAKFLTWRKNEGLKQPGETMKHLSNNFSKRQALGTCHTNASIDTFTPPPMSFQKYLKDICKVVRMPVCSPAVSLSFPWWSKTDLPRENKN